MQDELETFLLDEGYSNLVKLPTGELVGLLRFLFTVGLVVGLDRDGYRIRFCFENEKDALCALSSWDGRGYPAGAWIKAKGTNEDGVKVDDLNPNFAKSIYF